MTKNDMVEGILELYSRKLFLDREPELFREFQKLMYTLPEDILEGYLINAGELNQRPDTERGRKEGYNKLSALYRKMQSPIEELYDGMRDKTRHTQEGVHLDSAKLEPMMVYLQSRKLDKLKGDYRFTEHLYAMEKCTEKRVAKLEREEAVKKELERLNKAADALNAAGAEMTDSPLRDR